MRRTRAALNGKTSGSYTIRMKRLVIVGGGVSGLATAARLQAKGFSTIVFEAHGRAGGCAGYFRRKGFAFDVGGRWGSASAEFQEIKHRTDVIGGIWLGVQSDLVLPCGNRGAAFLAGFRLEAGYTWCDILQEQNNADVSDLKLLFHVGYRY